MSDTAAPTRAAPRRRTPIVYEGAGPGRLAATPSRAKRRTADATTSNWNVIRQHSERRINMQRSWRMTWLEHWQLLETYLLPRRGIFINTAMPTPNSMIRGSPINQAIADPTGVYAMRRCAAGLMSNEMSPSRQWFKLKPALLSREKSPPEMIEWFEEVENRMNTVLSGSNFYQEAAQVFEDLVVFGTAPMIIYEDQEDLIRCYTPCCGEYFISSSSANRAQTFSRQFVMTINAIVEMFSLENCPPDVQEMWQSKGGALEVEKLVAHIIEPNAEINAPGMTEAQGVVAGGFEWREAYWIWGASSEWPLSLTGFIEQPYICPRWAVTSNDPYGRSVAMDVLPDLMQLYVETGRKAEGLEKALRPPMLADISMKNEPASILPGKLTYVAGLTADKGMRPAYTVNPDLQHITADIMMVQQRIKEGFFSDLFAMLEQVTRQQTAYEVAARNQEKLQILGPVIERIQNELLAPAIKRVFRIMKRSNLLPPVPNAGAGMRLGIEYVGVLALAQKAAKTAGMERFASTMVSLSGTHPEVNDIWDPAEFGREYGEALFIPPKIMRTPEQAAAIAQARAHQAQAQATLQAGQQVADIAQKGAGAGASAAKIQQSLGPIQVGGGLAAADAASGLGAGGAPSGAV